MTIDTMLLGAGVFALILPSLGFPHTTDDMLMRVVGVVVIILAIALRRGGVSAARYSRKQTFEESRPVAPSAPQDSQGN